MLGVKNENKNVAPPFFLSRHFKKNMQQED